MFLFCFVFLRTNCLVSISSPSVCGTPASMIPAGSTGSLGQPPGLRRELPNPQALQAAKQKRSQLHHPISSNQKGPKEKLS